MSQTMFKILMVLAVAVALAKWARRRLVQRLRAALSLQPQLQG